MADYRNESALAGNDSIDPRVSVAVEPWRILIVGNDKGLHSATAFTLKAVQVEKRPIEISHAYAVAQAYEMLQGGRGFAVILLDEDIAPGDGSLKVVRHIRETLKLTAVRIILRTGQPDHSTIIEASRKFDISDAVAKSTTDKEMLSAAVASAIYGCLKSLSIDSSQRELDRINHAGPMQLSGHDLQVLALDLLEQIGKILAIDADGAVFVCGELHDAPVQFIAGAGSMRRRDGVQCGQNEAVIASAVTDACAQKQSVYRSNHVTFFLPGRAGRNYVAFLWIQRTLSPLDERLMEVYCANAVLGSENAELLSAMQSTAVRDPLSKLPNRNRMVEALDSTIAGALKAHAILVLIDLDHFADINDALGHRFGDLLLVGVANRLVVRLSHARIIARIGSDVFCVLGDSAVIDPSTIITLFDAPFLVDGQEALVSATLGVVRLSEHEGTGIDALKDADIALKRAKVKRRKGYVEFSREMGVEIRNRVRMMHALRQGFSNGELRLAYQPQVDLKTRRPTGAEILLRWERADGTAIPPDQFIPVAEYSGLIVDIGAWVLRSAFEELVRLRAAGYIDFTMSVNVSQVQFCHPQFLDMLCSALYDTQAPPACIELEITESVAMEDPDQLIKMLDLVKETGVSIAIDDFGTGFSSLSYLQRLKVDRLKIDRTFVTEITSSERGSSIAEMVIQLGRSLGLTVVAEGVENEGQAQILQGLGCHSAQGYLFAKPMPPHELYVWLSNELQKNEILAHARNQQVVLYTTPRCPDCFDLRSWLRSKGVAFEERDLTEPEMAAEAKARTGVRVAPITLVGETVFYGTFSAQTPGLATALGLSHGD